MPLKFNPTDEWLEADGLGGFASGTVSGIRTRRYHALLLAAATPPTGRFVLVNGYDAWVETPEGTHALTSQLYSPTVVSPDGAKRIDNFEPDPWPHWSFVLEDGTRIEQELLVSRGSALVVVAWRLAAKKENVRLSVRPFLSGRNYHHIHQANPAFQFDAAVQGRRVAWHPYNGVPGIVAISNGEYAHAPDWYRCFLYEEDKARGLDAVEDLASPGVFHFDLSRGEAVWVVGMENPKVPALSGDVTAETAAKKVRTAERLRRTRLPSRVQRSAEAYVVQRGTGKSIVAGYPWFTDWGRDTFIALRGLCLATGRFELAREILLTWAGLVSEGMLPNRFPDEGETAEYNSVDASLWFAVAVHDFLHGMEGRRKKATRADQKTLRDAVEAILEGYARGTRYGIRCDEDGLLAAGEPGVQLTWMDVKVGNEVVSPRIGKAVEVNALWLNALWTRSRTSPRWQELLARGKESFRARFWNKAGRCLYDVVDCGHQKGTTDATLRPNQIFAVGGLPLPVLEGVQARQVVDVVESHLLTPLGLRSLAPGEPGYAGRYEGGAKQRDRAYHSGTAWPWLLGPFVEAWVRVRGEKAAAKKQARARFLNPLLEHLGSTGLGHVSEIVDGDAPHTPRGCPFQAWSLGELLRLQLAVLA